MAYAAIPDSQIDADSPLIADTFFKLRDNPIAIANGDTGAPRIQSAAFEAGAVNEAAIGTAAVNQAALKTTTGTAGTGTIYSGASADVTIPGGLFYLGLETNLPSDGGSAWSCSWGTSTTGSYGAVPFKISKTGGSGGYAATLRSTYIQSSPPYDLGNGLAYDFIFIRIDDAGEIRGTYCAPDAPWHYYGPTSIRPDKIIKGKSYKRVPADVAAALKGGQRLSAFERLKRVNFDRSAIRVEEIEMTAEYKNLDMDIIPHPFHGVAPTDTIILLDPASNLARELQIVREEGETADELIMKGYLSISNTRARHVKGPKGVRVVEANWKDSQRFA